MALVPKVTLEDMGPGRTFVREGRYAEGMFMVSRGKVHVFVNGVQIAVRSQGEYVGEKSLVNDVPAKATCTTADWSTMLVLRRDDFKELCIEYPELLSRITMEIKMKEKQMRSEALRGPKEVKGSRKNLTVSNLLATGGTKSRKTEGNGLCA